MTENPATCDLIRQPPLPVTGKSLRRWVSVGGMVEIPPWRATPTRHEGLHKPNAPVALSLWAWWFCVMCVQSASPPLSSGQAGKEGDETFSLSCNFNTVQCNKFCTFQRQRPVDCLSCCWSGTWAPTDLRQLQQRCSKAHRTTAVYVWLLSISRDLLYLVVVQIWPCVHFTRCQTAFLNPIHCYLCWNRV